MVPIQQTMTRSLLNTTRSALGALGLLAFATLHSGGAQAETIPANQAYYYAHVRAATCTTLAAQCSWAQASIEACQGLGAYWGYGAPITWDGTPEPDA